MYKMMKQSKDLESFKRMRGTKTFTLVRKEDLLLLQKTDKEKKAEIERSHIYIGYKLLWII